MTNPALPPLDQPGVGPLPTVGHMARSAMPHDTTRDAGVRRPRVGNLLAATAIVGAFGLAACGQPPALQTAPSPSAQQFRTVAARPSASTASASSPTTGHPLAMRRQPWARLIAADKRVPAELRQTLADCRDICGVSSVEYGHVSGLTNEVAIVWVNGFNSPEGTVVFADLGQAAPTMVFTHYGPDALVTVANSNLVLKRAMYTANDAEASPSGPPEVSTYRWAGGHFVLASRVGGGATYSPYLPTDRVVI